MRRVSSRWARILSSALVLSPACSPPASDGTEMDGTVRVELYGQVVVVESLAPIPDVEVSLRAVESNGATDTVLATSQTSADGTWRLAPARLQPGLMYSLQATDAQGRYASISRPIAALESGRSEHRLDLAPTGSASGLTISGRVIDILGGGVALGGANVTLSAPGCAGADCVSYTVPSDADGAFTLPPNDGGPHVPLLVRPYRLGITKPAFVSASVDIRPDAGRTAHGIGVVGLVRQDADHLTLVLTPEPQAVAAGVEFDLALELAVPSFQAPLSVGEVFLPADLGWSTGFARGSEFWPFHLDADAEPWPLKERIWVGTAEPDNRHTVGGLTIAEGQAHATGVQVITFSRDSPVDPLPARLGYWTRSGYPIAVAAARVDARLPGNLEGVPLGARLQIFEDAAVVGDFRFSGESEPLGTSVEWVPALIEYGFATSGPAPTDRLYFSVMTPGTLLAGAPATLAAWPYDDARAVSAGMVEARRAWQDGSKLVISGAGAGGGALTWRGDTYEFVASGDLDGIELVGWAEAVDFGVGVDRNGPPQGVLVTYGVPYPLVAANGAACPLPTHLLDAGGLLALGTEAGLVPLEDCTAPGIDGAPSTAVRASAAWTFAAGPRILLGAEGSGLLGSPFAVGGRAATFTPLSGSPVPTDATVVALLPSGDRLVVVTRDRGVFLHRLAGGLDLWTQVTGEGTAPLPFPRSGTAPATSAATFEGHLVISTSEGLIAATLDGTGARVVESFPSGVPVEQLITFEGDLLVLTRQGLLRMR